MPRPIRITIPIPCHENWDFMVPAEKGRHCTACQKTVVDFTGMSDSDILRHLKKAGAGRSGARVCGRFMPDQLNRELIPPALLSGKFRWRGWEWVLTGLLLTSDVSSPRRHRLPLTEQRTQFKGEDSGGDVFVGMMAFAPIQVQSSVDLKIDTTEVAIKGEIMGDIGIVVPDSLSIAPDSFPRPNGALKIDTIEAPAVTGGIEVEAVNGTDSLPGSDSSAESIAAPARLSTYTDHAPVALDPAESAEKILHIFPNPIPRGSTYRLRWPDNPGRYQLSLFNSNGALVQQTIVDVTGYGQTNDFQLPPGLAAGVYILRAARTGQSQPYTAKLLIQ